MMKEHRFCKERNESQNRRRKKTWGRGIFAAVLAAAALTAGCAFADAGTAAGTGSQESVRNEPAESSPQETAAVLPTETAEKEGRTTEEGDGGEADWRELETESGEPDHLHTYGEWTITEKATKWQAGTRERTCRECGHVEVRRIAAGHHEYDPQSGICLEEGCRDGDPDFFTEEWFFEGILRGHPDAPTARKLTLPGSVGDDPVEGIGYGAFAGCANLREVTILPGPETIYMSAFEDCTGLTQMKLPNSVRAIDDSVFAGCSGLETLTFGRNIKTFGYNSFSCCTSLTEITIPGSVIDITAGAFANCTSLAKVTLKSGSTHIDEYCFLNCTSLTSLQLPESIIYIGLGAFSGCTALESIGMPSKLETLDSEAFAGCSSLTSIQVPSGVELISYGVFRDCSALREVTLPKTIESIELEAFAGCGRLKEITIPSAVEYVDAEAFKGCRRLETLVYKGTEYEEVEALLEKLR
ncbi:MAG: leucine-rich repeat domain-containing protein [Lachnospiraceae bacterium]|nr:leucine-rich repeat domain-containing protein [Lachnospiraceae bacterium]